MCIGNTLQANKFANTVHILQHLSIGLTSNINIRL